MTRSTRSRCHRLRAIGTPSRKTTSAAERDEVQRVPVGAGAGTTDELRAGGELVAERERDAEVGVQVHEVPRLVAQPAPHGDGRGHHHADQEVEPRDRRDHAWIAGDQPRDLVRQRDAVADRVAGDDQHDVREQQRERRLAVDPVPDRQRGRSRRDGRAPAAAPAAAARRARGRRRAAPPRARARSAGSRCRGCRAARRSSPTGPPRSRRCPARGAPGPSRRSSVGDSRRECPAGRHEGQPACDPGA